ncbi:DUF1007 family protein [Rhizobium sp. G187]|uniref:DUF1007 family protein n=1 Tax=Rhizobium sp. G187 TaxID=3451352 RepID=UPI003EE79CCB
MINRMGLIALTIVSFLAGAGASSAHPDVSVASRILLDLDGGRLTGFATLMGFDTGTSRRLFIQADHDADGQLSISETEDLKQVMLERLKRMSAFTEVKREAQAIALPDISFSRLDYADGALRLTLAYRFPEPVEMSGKGVDILLRDRDLALAFRLDPQLPVVLRGEAAGCAATVARRAEEAYFGGLVVPDVVTLTCR